jgi:hypothetical protein
MCWYHGFGRRLDAALLLVVTGIRSGDARLALRVTIVAMMYEWDDKKTSKSMKLIETSDSPDSSWD